MKIVYEKVLNGYTLDKNKLFEEIYYAMKLKRWFIPFTIRHSADSSKHIHLTITLSYNGKNGDIFVNLYDLADKRRQMVVWENTDSPFNFLYEGDGVVSDKLWSFVNQLCKSLHNDNGVEIY